MNEIYTLKLTKDQLNIINMALIELPFKVVANLINEINEQLIVKEDEEVKL